MNERAHGHTSRFDRVVLAIIATNAVVLVAALAVGGQEQIIFDTIHDGIVAFFVCELLARLKAHGLWFLRRPWNAFDAVVIVVSVMPVLGVDASLLRLARLARLVHFARHAGHLRAMAWLGRRLPAQ